MINRSKINQLGHNEIDINHLYHWEDVVRASCAIRLLFASAPVELDGGFWKFSTCINRRG